MSCVPVTVYVLVSCVPVMVVWPGVMCACHVLALHYGVVARRYIQLSCSFHGALISGMLQADPGVIRDNHQIFRLFVHETQRVFHDRLINNEDKFYFHQIMAEMASKHFGEVS